MLHRKNYAHTVKAGSRNVVLFAAASLVWFVFRTGTKPTRIVYPCQRAALANISVFLGIMIPLSLTALLARTRRFLSRRMKTATVIAIIAVTAIIGGQILGAPQLAQAIDPRQEIHLLLEARNATVFPASDIFVVNGREPANLPDLINLMGGHGLPFYRSASAGTDRGPDGLIARDDVVLLKINEQWRQRGGTNTDLLKGLIQAIIDHPDSFSGEIVVADNGQGFGSMNWYQNNAEDISQSTQDVVDMFSPTHHVSTYDWQPIRGTRVQEYSDGDMADGYLLSNDTDPETGIYVSYPKFTTDYGTRLSFKHGVWNGTGYEKRLKVINLPVLKSHRIYGVTASTKNYMGVQSEGYSQPTGLANGHVSVGTGGMGTLLSETMMPTLNILDATWVNANPFPFASSGPATYYSTATRANVIMASVDPVALDYWAAKHVLVPAAHAIGYVDNRTLNPDNTVRLGLQEAFGVWLNLTKNELVADGFNVTTNEARMNVYIRDDQCPPAISLASPLNTTYGTPAMPLTVTSDEPTSWIGYSLDEQENLTMIANTSLTDLSDGAHSIVVYANDTSGNMATSAHIYFTVDTMPPEILEVAQTPPATDVLPDDGVEINATLTDHTSGIKQATLVYAFTNSTGPWIRVEAMVPLGANVWNALIPAFPRSTNVTYVVIAEDVAGHSIATSDLGYTYQYHVVPEFPALIILPLLVAATLITAISMRARKG
jgi:hypothetical protein